MRFVYEIICILKGDLGVRRVNVKKQQQKKNVYFCTIYVHVYEIVLRCMIRANEVVRASILQ